MESLSSFHFHMSLEKKLVMSLLMSQSSCGWSFRDPDLQISCRYHASNGSEQADMPFTYASGGTDKNASHFYSAGSKSVWNLKIQGCIHVWLSDRW